MWKTIVEGKPLTRLILFLVICAALFVAQPLVQAFPPLHVLIVYVCLFMFISFVI